MEKIELEETEEKADSHSEDYIFLRGLIPHPSSIYNQLMIKHVVWQRCVWDSKLKNNCSCVKQQ